jgi:hypothetical protein
MTPAHQGHVPFGPEVSWPNGYPALGHPDGGYRYGAPQAAPAASHGAHPYASFSAAGYGDDGYSDPAYQGPVAQDAGIPGTPTVRGFVESDRSEPGYPLSSPVRSDYAAARYDQPGFAGSGYGEGQIEIAYPLTATGGYRGTDLYNQPWDYDQPLRYDGEEVSFPAGDYGRSGGYDTMDGPSLRDDGAVRYEPPAYDPGAYNGSDYSMPGISGPGYDLSGIIGTKDFEAIGYDEPSYGRLSYDDPRYDDRRYDDRRYETGGYPASGSRFDGPRFDETRLDNSWLAGADDRRDAGPAGYGNDGFGSDRARSEFPVSPGRRRAAETRYDLRALTEAGDSTRFDVPVFDETRLDNLRSLTPGRGMRPVGTAVLAPPAVQPRGWAEDTSLDHFADLDLTDEPVPAAFTRTLDRPRQDEETGAHRAIGRRRGRSGDRRQWMALGAIAVVAAGAIGGVLMKYVFSGPSGPAHSIVAPATADGYNRSPGLEKQLHVNEEAAQVARASSGQASDVVSAVYQQGSISATAGGNAQIFMFVGGKLAGADPGASVANFEQTYKGAQAVPTGSLGGSAACTTTTLNDQSASMCVWFDNDTFGTLVSPTMTTAKLAATMDAARPSLERYQQ